LVNRNALTEFLGQAQASGILRHDGHGGSRRPTGPAPRADISIRLREMWR